MREPSEAACRKILKNHIVRLARCNLIATTFVLPPVVWFSWFVATHKENFTLEAIWYLCVGCSLVMVALVLSAVLGYLWALLKIDTVVATASLMRKIATFRECSEQLPSGSVTVVRLNYERFAPIRKWNKKIKEGKLELNKYYIVHCARLPSYGVMNWILFNFDLFLFSVQEYREEKFLNSSDKGFPWEL